MPGLYGIAVCVSTILGEVGESWDRQIMLDMACETWWKKYENKILNNNYAMAFCRASTKVVDISHAQYNIV